MQKVLITGATSGIGLAIAWRMADRAALVLTGRKPKEEICGMLPPGSEYVAADHCRPESATAAIISKLSSLGWTTLDLAILNAGTGRAIDPAMEKAEMIRQTLDTNLATPVLLSNSLHPFLVRGNGRLVLIGSQARRGAAVFASYAASKAALAGFARALAEEWRERVIVQVIHPGPVATGMHSKAGYDSGRARRFYLSADVMAAMIDAIIRRRRRSATASYARYFLTGRWIRGQR